MVNKNLLLPMLLVSIAAITPVESMIPSTEGHVRRLKALQQQTNNTQDLEQAFTGLNVEQPDPVSDHDQDEAELPRMATQPVIQRTLEGKRAKGFYMAQPPETRYGNIRHSRRAQTRTASTTTHLSASAHGGDVSSSQRESIISHYEIGHPTRAAVKRALANPFLEELILNGTITDDQNRPMIEFDMEHPNLKTLRIINNKALLGIKFIKTPKLTTFDISGCTNLLTLGAVGEKMPPTKNRRSYVKSELQNLIINGCYNLNIDNVVENIRRCPLVGISLVGCSQIDKDEILAILREGRPSTLYVDNNISAICAGVCLMEQEIIVQ